MAAAAVDQSRMLQLSGRVCDGFTAHAEHIGDQSVRHRELVRGQPIHARKDPSAQSLFHRVAPIARADLSGLRDQRKGVAQQQAGQRTVVIEGALRPICGQPITMSGTQHH